MMKFLYLVIATLVLKCSNGIVHNVERSDNEAISTYVRNLIFDLAQKDSRTHDIAIFRLNQFKHTKQQIDDMFEDLCKAVPKNVIVSYPPLSRTITKRNLRPTSYTILVTDISNTVRKMIIISNLALKNI